MSRTGRSRVNTFSQQDVSITGEISLVFCALLSHDTFICQSIELLQHAYCCIIREKVVNDNLTTPNRKIPEYSRKIPRHLEPSPLLPVSQWNYYTLILPQTFSTFPWSYRTHAVLEKQGVTHVRGREGVGPRRSTPTACTTVTSSTPALTTSLIACPHQ